MRVWIVVLLTDGPDSLFSCSVSPQVGAVVLVLHHERLDGQTAIVRRPDEVECDGRRCNDKKIYIYKYKYIALFHDCITAVIIFYRFISWAVNCGLVCAAAHRWRARGVLKPLRQFRSSFPRLFYLNFVDCIMAVITFNRFMLEIVNCGLVCAAAHRWRAQRPALLAVFSSPCGSLDPIQPRRKCAAGWFQLEISERLFGI